MNRDGTVSYARFIIKYLANNESTNDRLIVSIHFINIIIYLLYTLKNTFHAGISLDKVLYETTAYRSSHMKILCIFYGISNNVVGHLE